MNILAFDQATGLTGMCCFSFDEEINYLQLIEFKVFDYRKEENLIEKLWKLTCEVDELIERHNPGLIIIEEIFLGRNVETFKKLCKTQAAIQLLAARRGIVCEVISPMKARSFFGVSDKKGAASIVVDIFKPLKGARLDVTDAAFLGLYWSKMNECVEKV